MSTQSEILAQYIWYAIKKEIVVHFCWYSSSHPNSLVHLHLKRISWNKRDSLGFLRFSRNSIGPYLENYLGLWPSPPFISQIFECLCVLQVNVAKWTGWAVFVSLYLVTPFGKQSSDLVPLTGHISFFN